MICNPVVSRGAHLPRARVCRLLALVAASLAMAIPALAQVDPGFHTIFQDGVKVGEIYVPSRSDSESLYFEHWVLLPGYKSPSVRTGVATEIVPAANAYRSEADFFARVSFPEGARYVKVMAHESDELACP